MTRPTLPRYHLPEPTEADAIEALTRVLGERRARLVWQGACDELGFPPDHSALSFPELRRVADLLAKQPTAVGPCGVALRTRMAAYESILARVSGVHLSKTR
jgi:hypothetical protein